MGDHSKGRTISARGSSLGCVSRILPPRHFGRGLLGFLVRRSPALLNRVLVLGIPL